jgi:hypothetical protein
MLATIENMQRTKGVAGVLAWSPTTGEEYSADPGDYWNAPAGWTIRDEDGEPMVLVVRREEFVAVEL